MSSRLDISQLKFDQNDIGNLIKSTKTIYSWEFVLDGNRHKIELQHSRLKGKRIVIYNGKEMSNSMVFTYNYCYLARASALPSGVLLICVGDVS